MNEVVNNNKYKLKYWFGMLYTHVGKFMIGYMFTNQRLSKDFILFLYQNLGTNFRAPKSGYRSQKRLVLPPALDL